MLHIESFLETEEDSDAVAAKKAERTETEIIEETAEEIAAHSEEVEAQGTVSLSTIVEKISSESKKSDKKQSAEKKLQQPAQKILEQPAEQFIGDSKLPPEFTRGYEARTTSAAAKTKISDETKELIQQHIADAQTAFAIGESIDDAIGVSEGTGIAEDAAFYGRATDNFSETDGAYDAADAFADSFIGEPADELTNESLGAISSEYSTTSSAEKAKEKSAKKDAAQSSVKSSEKKTAKKTVKSAKNTSSKQADAAEKPKKPTVSRKKTVAAPNVATQKSEEDLASSPSFFEDRELMELSDSHAADAFASDSAYAYGSYSASETELSDTGLSDSIADLETAAATDAYASQDDTKYTDAHDLNAQDIADIDTSFEASDIAGTAAGESAYDAQQQSVPASPPRQKKQTAKNAPKEEKPVLSPDDLYDISTAFDIPSVSVDDEHLSELISQAEGHAEDQAEEETPAFDYLYSEESSLTQDNLDDIDRAYEISTASLAAQRLSRASRYIEADDNDIVHRSAPAYSLRKTSEQSVNKQCDEIENSLSSLEEKIRAMVGSESDSLARPIRRLRTVAAAREAKQKTVKAINSVEKKRKLPTPNEAVWYTLTGRQRTALIIIINSMERCFRGSPAYANFANDDAYALYRVLRSALSR